MSIVLEVVDDFLPTSWTDEPINELVRHLLVGTVCTDEGVCSIEQRVFGVVGALRLLQGLTISEHFSYQRLVR